MDGVLGFWVRGQMPAPRGRMDLDDGIAEQPAEPIPFELDPETIYREGVCVRVRPDANPMPCMRLFGRSRRHG